MDKSYALGCGDHGRRHWLHKSQYRLYLVVTIEAPSFVSSCFCIFLFDNMMLVVASTQAGPDLLLIYGGL
jgi:hypothetical protein